MKNKKEGVPDKMALTTKKGAEGGHTTTQIV